MLFPAIAIVVCAVVIFSYNGIDAWVKYCRTSSLTSHKDKGLDLKKKSGVDEDEDEDEDEDYESKFKDDGDENQNEKNNSNQFGIVSKSKLKKQYRRTCYELLTASFIKGYTHFVWATMALLNFIFLPITVKALQLLQCSVLNDGTQSLVVTVLCVFSQCMCVRVCACVCMFPAAYSIRTKLCIY